MTNARLVGQKKLFRLKFVLKFLIASPMARVCVDGAEEEKTAQHS